MKLKVFTLRFSDGLEGFDDAPFQEFAADKEVVDYVEHFFFHEKKPYLTIILSYREIAPEERRRIQRESNPRNELDETEKIVFDALREWRAARAKQEGIPPYLIANNRQLAKMIKMKAASKADLTNVGGIGEAKVESYGEEMLKVIAQATGPEAADEKALSEEQPKDKTE